jgi:hypothetical protein
MEQSKSKVVTEELRHEFRSYIEGCTPDLMEAGGGLLEDSPDDYRDAIHDHAADSSVWLLKGLSDADRRKLVAETVDYICGPCCNPSKVTEDVSFPVSDLFPGEGT